MTTQRCFGNKAFIVVYLLFNVAITLFAQNIEQGKVKVGVIMSIGGIDDKSFNEMTYKGIKKLRAENNIILDVYEPHNIDSIMRGVEMFCHANYDLIIGIGIFSTSAIEHFASMFPMKKFAIIDSAVDLPNVISILYNEQQGAFYIGAIASLITKTNKIGFIGGMISPIIKNFECGYKNGAKFTNSEVTVLAEYIGDTPEAFSKPDIASKLAQKMSNNGVDIIFHAAGGSGLGVIEGARKFKYLVIGVDSDQTILAPGKVVASLVKRLDVGVTKAIQKYLEGSKESESQFKSKSNVFTLGIADNAFEIILSRYNKALFTDEIHKKIKDVEAFLLHNVNLGPCH